MPIVCPHCATSYAVDSATLGTVGRTVRCARCKKTWLARPEPAMAMAAQTPEPEDDMAWPEQTTAHDAPSAAPMVDSPSIVSDWPVLPDSIRRPTDDAVAIAHSAHDNVTDGNIIDGNAVDAGAVPPERRQRQRRARTTSRFALPASLFSLSSACAAMGALLIALVVWRADVVRLLPQTASFYKLVGLDVNLRGLAFKDVKLSTETADGKPVLLIEGVIVGEARKAVELPRLRFVVRDAKGTEIYAWNAVLEQAVLKPGDKAWFRSRLASPPAEGASVDIRFFNKRDLAAGSA